MDLVEWERFGYRKGLSRREVEQMTLREYILRRQGHMRDSLETLRLETLPIVNAWSNDEITARDFFGGAPKTQRDEEKLKAFRYEVATKTDLIDDWSLVDPELEDALNG